MRRRTTSLSALALAALLAGCASMPAEDALAPAREWAARSGAPTPVLAADERTAATLRDERERLLAGPLSLPTALELALRSSPGMQALLAEGWRVQADTAASAAFPRIGFAFERKTHGGEVALTRGLSLSLTDLLTLPWRQRAADRAIQAQRLQLAADVLARQQAVRAQWVKAVAARQLVAYHADVREAAQASAELARRMQAVGNFSRLQRAREQAFLADATANLARARAAAETEAEALVRLLGLTPAEAARLQWPQRLPDLPAAPREAAEVTRAAAAERLDLRVASAALDASARAEGLVLPTLFDIGLALHRESEPGGERTRGTELAFAIPGIDGATLRRQGARAGTLAAAQRLEQARIDAASTLRERFFAWRTAHDLARHYRLEVVPLRQTITDESLLKYNGMLIGVFELLAEARSQVGAVIAAIEAERDFWLADAALEAAILGVPGSPVALPAAAPAAAESAAKGH